MAFTRKWVALMMLASAAAVGSLLLVATPDDAPYPLVLPPLPAHAVPPFPARATPPVQSAVDAETARVVHDTLNLERQSAREALQRVLEQGQWPDARPAGKREWKWDGKHWVTEPEC